MKILGALIYILGFLGVGFVITETDFDLGGSFFGIVLTFLWLVLTMGIGSLLMKIDNKDDKDNNDE